MPKIRNENIYLLCEVYYYLYYIMDEMMDCGTQHSMYKYKYVFVQIHDRNKFSLIHSPFAGQKRKKK